MKRIYAVLLRTAPPILIPFALEPGKDVPEIVEWMGAPHMIGKTANGGEFMKVLFSDIVFHQLTDEESLRRRPILVDPGAGRIN